MISHYHSVSANQYDRPDHQIRSRIVTSERFSSPGAMVVELVGDLSKEF